jgi:structural maintenance of chromosome 1
MYGCCCRTCCCTQHDLSLFEASATAAAESPELQQLRASVVDKRKQLAKMEGRLNEIKDRIFADFSRRVGVPNIRVYEETTLAAANKLEEQKEQHEEQVT